MMDDGRVELVLVKLFEMFEHIAEDLDDVTADFFVCAYEKHLILVSDLDVVVWHAFKNN